MTFAEDLELLDLEDECSVVEVKTAFRELARRHHPDLGGDRDAFERCREAFTRVLIDAVTRESRCEDCDGSGTVYLSSKRSFAVLKQTCARCLGTGKR